MGLQNLISIVHGCNISINGNQRGFEVVCYASPDQQGGHPKSVKLSYANINKMFTTLINRDSYVYPLRTKIIKIRRETKFFDTCLEEVADQCEQPLCNAKGGANANAVSLKGWVMIWLLK